MTKATENDDVGSFVHATSGYRAYAHREREDLWRDRLALNAAELERLSSFSGLGEAPLQTIESSRNPVRCRLPRLAWNPPARFERKAETERGLS
jgi:hypothetical protein